MSESSPWRGLPSVDKVLQTLGDVNLPRPLVLAVVRRQLDALRQTPQVPDLDTILGGIRSALEQVAASRIQPVINATGVLIHTNLGRAPMGDKAIEAVAWSAREYSNLEFDLTCGSRGARAAYVDQCLALVCGAEAATVVNNCAAALVLILRHATAKKRDVVISRGELVQIGGGFRVPEILAASGAELREVGTTNRTTLDDYSCAIGDQTGLILKVHRSNFYMDGFVESPSTRELSGLARQRGVLFVEDLGSGAVINTEALAAVEHEPTPREILSQGAHLVCFSGDKLLGGPQAGIIAGQSALVNELKREPFFRALRCDKLILAALQATVEGYLREEAIQQAVPVLQMLAAPVDELLARAQAMVEQLQDLPATARIGQSAAQAGGGALPRSTVPSITVDLVPRAMSLEDLASRLRQGNPPIIACIAGDRLRLDLRAVFPRQDQALLQGIRAALGACSRESGR